MTNLLPSERIDDLQRKGYKIIQNPEKFCFGMDAVLLSSFAAVKEGENVLDMGTGTGIIPILLEAKTEGKHFTGLEIQSESAEMAGRSVALNNLTEKIDIVEGDIKEATKIFGKNIFNVVTVNPPYMNDLHGIKNPDMPKAIARHEVLCTLEDVVREASGVLKQNGRLYMVHRPHRLVEIIQAMKNYKLEPKRIRFVHPYEDKEANMVLIEALKGGKSMVKIEKPLIVYKDVNVYTDELLEMYGNE
jgi:tRNA1(Val) A37 N6-methylase TrmN6